MISIRDFDPADAEAVSRVIVRNLELLNIKDYPAQTIQALAKFYTPERLIKESGHCHMVVGHDEAELLGTAAVDVDRVRNVFVAMDRHGEGIGRRLMLAIETYAREQRQSELFLHAVPSARGFYEKLGYEAVGRIEREVGSSKIVEIKMAKHLPGLNSKVVDRGKRM